MRTKSKIDKWISVVIWGTVLIMILSVLLIPENERMIGYVIVLPVTLLMFWIYYGTYYEIRDEYLYCKSGPFFEKIAYENIKSLRMSKNFASSMALSRERIEIRQHRKGYILGTTFISPVNREDFMRELTSRCKNLDM